MKIVERTIAVLRAVKKYIHKQKSDTNNPKQVARQCKYWLYTNNMSIGRMKIKPGQTTTLPMKMGGKSIVEPGKWSVQYVPVQKELNVTIVLEHFRVEMGGNVVEGESIDLFFGQISESKEEWKAEWYSSPRYVVSTDEYESYELPMDPNENMKIILFEKVPNN